MFGIDLVTNVKVVRRSTYRLVGPRGIWTRGMLRRRHPWLQSVLFCCVVIDSIEIADISLPGRLLSLLILSRQSQNLHAAKDHYTVRCSNNGRLFIQLLDQELECLLSPWSIPICA